MSVKCKIFGMCVDLVIARGGMIQNDSNMLQCMSMSTVPV